MTRLHRIIVIVPKHIKKRKITTINPTSSLRHQLLVRFHRVSKRKRIRNILQVIFPIMLTVNSQTQDSILGQIHICLHVVLLLVVWVQYQLEVLSL